MTTARTAPPLPQPQRPAEAAHAVARAAARAWTGPMTPEAHARAVSQLHSVLRDLGIASRGLAAWSASTPADIPAPGFPVHIRAGSAALLEAWQHLDGVLAAEGIPPSGDPDDPGAALCRAARDAILAWRQPAGTAADRHDTTRQLITATVTITAAVTDLADSAPRQLAISLQAAVGSLADAIACLTAAIHCDEDAARPGRLDGRQ